MAARKTAAERKTEQEAAEAAEAAASPEQNPNGVFIEKVVGEGGNVQVNVAPIGNVQITEVQTLVEIGLRTFRDQIGLGGQPGR